MKKLQKKLSQSFIDLGFAGKMRRYNKDRLKIQSSIHNTQGILDSLPSNSHLSLTEMGERQLMLRLEKLAHIEGLRDDRTKVKIPLSVQALIDSKANDSEVLKMDGGTILEGPFIFKELTDEPDDPDEGHAVMWMSNGTGSGDNGDIMIKISSGGVTKTATLVDFSAI